MDATVGIIFLFGVAGMMVKANMDLLAIRHRYHGCHHEVLQNSSVLIVIYI